MDFLLFNSFFLSFVETLESVKKTGIVQPFLLNKSELKNKAHIVYSVFVLILVLLMKIVNKYKITHHNNAIL